MKDITDHSLQDDRGLSFIPSELLPYRIALKMIPDELYSLFYAYFLLTNQNKTLKYTDWETIPSNFSQGEFPLPDPSSRDYFERNPIAYLTDLHNQVEELPHILSRLLRMLYETSGSRPCAKKVFLRLLHNIRYSTQPYIPLTDAMKTVIGIRILYPLASTHELAKKLRISPQTFNYHIRAFKSKFEFYKVIWYDWYKFGLSRVYLFPHFRNRHNLDHSRPVTQLYFENEIAHRLPVEHDVFSIQTYTPPQSKWTEFRRRCEEVFEKQNIRWLADFPALYYSESRLIFLNLNTYDPIRQQFIANEPYLEYCLTTDVLDSPLEIEFSPALKIDFDINAPRETFDALDLQIIHNFYELEGYREQFVNTRYVAKHLNVSEHTVARRVDRLLNRKMIGFYYQSPLRLPRVVDVIILLREENDRLRDLYLKIIQDAVPYSHHTKIRSFPKGYMGVGSVLWVPPGSRVSYILRDFLLSREDVIGFCAESTYQWAGHRSVSDHWDDTYHRWRLDLPDSEYVLDLVRELSVGMDNMVEVQDVINRAEKEGMRESQVLDIIQRYKSDGILYEPQKNYIQPT